MLKRVITAIFETFQLIDLLLSNKLIINKGVKSDFG